MANGLGQPLVEIDIELEPPGSIGELPNVEVEVEEQPKPRKRRKTSQLDMLTEFVGVPNIADEIDKTLLDEIGERIKRQFDEDLESMQDWMDVVKKGIKLTKQEFKTKSIPWEGASNFKSPMLSEASISFGNKAVLELLRGDKLVKGAVIGRDEDRAKKRRVERVTEAMNYQLNYEMMDWRDDQKRLLYTLPNVGCMFKKTLFNPLEMVNESHVIQYPDFVVNQATTSMNTCRSFTQILSFDQNEVVERQRSGLWSEDVEIYPKDSEGDKGSNEEEGVTDAAKNDNRFFEQQCFADLDEDGYEEPYTITIHELSRKIVRVVARYDESSFIIRTKEGEILPLKKAIVNDARRMVERGLQPPEQPDLSQYELIRIDPFQAITKYGFISAPDGTFLDLGYSHLLGAITQGVNTTTNQLVDSGTLRNVGGGMMAKSVRKKMGPLRIRIGEWVSTELSPDNLQRGFFPNPQPEPSQTLFALNEKLEQTGRGFAAISDAAGAIQANTAPTTALAIIQENLIPTSALLAKILDSESKEFQVLFRLNQRFFDPELYKEILDEPDASSFADFNSENMDIQPTASAEMSSKLQRIQLATVELEQFDRVVQVGGNAKAILRGFYEAIGTQNIDEIFPDPSTMTPEEKKQIEDLQQQQELLAQQQQQQIELTAAQVELAKGELDRLTFRTKTEVDKMLAEIDKMRSEMLLNLEKAETEQITNDINIYTSSIATLTQSAERIRATLEGQSIGNTSRQQPPAPRAPGPVQQVAP